MNKADHYYFANLKKILSEKCMDENPRTKWADDTPAHSMFTTQVFEEYDIANNEFPITTLRKTAIKTGIKEILWIYQEQTSSLEVARKMGITWWDQWDIGDATIGRRYGATVRLWDLMNKLLFSLKNDPFSRRHIMNLYQEQDLQLTQGLYPCAYETIWSVRKVDNEFILDMTLVQRSNDYLVAGYINKIQYVALQMMVAGHLNYKVGKFCHLVQNLHIYDRHFAGIQEILDRKPFEDNFPYIEISGNKNFYDYTIDDFKVYNVSGIENISFNLELAI